MRLHGTVVRGHGVASGRNPDSPFPAGTIALQQPHFAARGLDLSGLHLATINVQIDTTNNNDEMYALGQPAHTFRLVDWTDVHPPETFSFYRCELITTDERSWSGWVYLPHPETKPMHEQPAAVLELLMPFIPGLTYGDAVCLDV